MAGIYWLQTKSQGQNAFLAFRLSKLHINFMKQIILSITLILQMRTAGFREIKSFAYGRQSPAHELRVKPCLYDPTALALNYSSHLPHLMLFMFSSVQSLSRVLLFATPWITAHQASLSITNSRSSLRLSPSSQWCHSAISSSVVPFSSCPQSLPASESFPMSQLMLETLKHGLC